MRFIILLAIPLCACARMTWTKADYTEEGLYQDRGQCQAQAFSAPNPNTVGIVFNACMRGKDWYLAPPVK
jgi:hypothetical protein